MKAITFTIVLAIWVLAGTLAYGQESTNSKIELLEKTRTEIVNSEKEALKNDVENINKRLESGAITSDEAETLKREAAEMRAMNIDNKLAIIDNKIELLKRNGDSDDSKKKNIFSFEFGSNDDEDAAFGIKFEDVSESERKFDRRTKSQLVFAFGLNNSLIEGQSLDDSPYKIGGSRFAELGLVWSTRVFKESNWVRFKYGFSFQFNGLKPDDNNYFVDQGDETVLAEFPAKLDKSKFRMDNLVIPVHFEFGPSKKIEKEHYFRYNTEHSFKIGLGGYAGLNLSTRQKLKFEDGNEDVKQKLKANYNTNNFIYGLSGYIGYGDISIYAKYDLNTIFKNNPIEQNNVSLGVRWDWD